MTNELELLVTNFMPKKGMFEKLGFVVEEIGDGLFQMNLPASWGMKPTSNTDLIIYDDKGRVRATYAEDDSSVELHTFYRITVECPESTSYKAPLYVRIRGGNGAVTREVTQVRRDSQKVDEVIERGKKEAKKFLDLNYPKWDDPRKYWE